MEEYNNLEKLKKRLYKKGSAFDSRMEREKLKGGSENVAPYWDIKENDEINMKSKRKKISLIKIFIFLSIFFLFGAGGLSAYIWYSGVNVVSSSNVAVDIAGPVYVDGGQAGRFNIMVKNQNTVPLELSDLIIDFPENSFSPEGSKLNRQRISLGKIDPGITINKQFDIVFFGLENEEKKIGASLEYRIAESNAIFAKESQYAVRISKAPIGIAVTLPKDASSGQKIPIKVEVISNSESTAKKIRLEVKYPPGFKFISADALPAESNNVWNLGDLGSKQKRVINIHGTVGGQDMEERAFVVSVGSVSDSGNLMSYGVATEKVIIKKSPLNLAIYLNGADEDKILTYPGNNIRVELEWANNLADSIRNAQIELDINGAAFDEKTISISRGYQRTQDKKIIWNPSSLSDLAEIPPGQNGRAQMNFLIKNPLPIKTSSDKNFSVSVSAKVTGSGTSDGFENREISASAEKKILVSSMLQTAGKTFYYSGPIKNSGPIPPKIGKETTYTIMWSLANNHNDLSGVKVSASIPPYVKFMDVASPNDSALRFDEKTSSVVWGVGNIPSGTGIIMPAKEVAFQVSFAPNATQINDNPVIVSVAQVEAKDDFTENNLRLEIPPLTTKLDFDPLFKGNDDTVKE